MPLRLRGKGKRREYEPGLVRIFQLTPTSGIRMQGSCNVGDTVLDCFGMISDPHIRWVRQASRGDGGEKTVSPVLDGFHGNM